MICSIGRITSLVLCKGSVISLDEGSSKCNTHDWNYDKPYEWEWGLETLTGKTFVKNKLF